VRQLFRRLKRISGITDKRVSAHTCRHWYAIRFLLKGGKLFALQRHLGHETLEMVKVYAYIRQIPPVSGKYLKGVLRISTRLPRSLMRWAFFECVSPRY